MKLYRNKANFFIKSGLEKSNLCLIYGPNQGLASLTAQEIIQNYRKNKDIEVIKIKYSEISSFEDFYSDVLNSSLFAGERVFHVIEANAGSGSYFKDLLENQMQLSNKLVIEAGDLTPSASLRKNFEADKHAYAIACYTESEYEIENKIKNFLASNNISFDIDAVSYLALSLQADSRILEQELNKISLYFVGNKNILSYDLALKLVPNSNLISADEFCMKILNKQKSSALREFKKLLNDEVSIIWIIRALGRYINNIIYIKTSFPQESNFESAIKGLATPIFFKYKAFYKDILAKYELLELYNMLEELILVESATKNTGSLPVIEFEKFLCKNFSK